MGLCQEVPVYGDLCQGWSLSRGVVSVRETFPHTVKSGWYASYWNAFLLLNCFCYASTRAVKIRAYLIRSPNLAYHLPNKKLIFSSYWNAFLLLNSFCYASTRAVKIRAYLIRSPNLAYHLPNKKLIFSGGLWSQVPARGVLCPDGSLSGGPCLWGSLPRVVSVQGCGLCQGDLPPYSEEWVVCILLECFLVA